MNGSGLKGAAKSRIPEFLRKLSEPKQYSGEVRQRNRSPGPKETWVIEVDWQLQGQIYLPPLHSEALMCCGSINLARYIYSSDSQREEWFGARASAESTRLFAPLPGKPVMVLRQLGNRVSFPGRICRQKIPSLLCSRNVCNLCLTWTWAQGPCLILEAAVTALHLRPVASSGFCLSAGLMFLYWGLSRWGTDKSPL